MKKARKRIFQLVMNAIALFVVVLSLVVFVAFFLVGVSYSINLIENGHFISGMLLISLVICVAIAGRSFANT